MSPGSYFTEKRERERERDVLLQNTGQNWREHLGAKNKSKFKSFKALSKCLKYLFKISLKSLNAVNNYFIKTKLSVLWSFFLLELGNIATTVASM